MKRFTKYKSPLILLIFLTATVLNKYVVEEGDKILGNSADWFIAMFALAFSLFIYSLADVINTKSGLALAICFIFASESIAVLKGWDLRTNYYTEFVLFIALGGLFYLFKSLWHKLYY